MKTPTSERLVVVISYDVEEDTSEQTLAEAMEQVRGRLTHPDQPHVKVVQVYAAIRGDAARVLDVFGAR